MSTTRGTFRYLVQLVQGTPREQEARAAAKAQREALAEQERGLREYNAQLIRATQPHPLDAAIEKAKADRQLAANAPRQLKIEDSVYVTGTALRERKDQADRAIKQKNKAPEEG
jgi:hypothetical protein